MRLGDYISPMRELGVPDQDITLVQRHRNYAKTLVEAPLYNLLLISIKKSAVDRSDIISLQKLHRKLLSVQFRDKVATWNNLQTPIAYVGILKTKPCPKVTIFRTGRKIGSIPMDILA